MAIYRMGDQKIEEIVPTTFAVESITEKELQHRLKQEIGVLFPGEDGKARKDAALIVAEEFSNFDKSDRRIDLLALDNRGNLVVIELKRTEGGNHMELQALRYAAMVSTMTFDSLVTTYARYGHKDEEEARETLLGFLGEGFDVEDFNTETHIVLASADFSKELMATVLWLNGRYDMGIRCVRMRPYRDGDTILLDIHPLVPLPEAEHYLIRAGEKAQEEKKARGNKRSRYRVTVRGETSPDITGMGKALMFAIKSLIKEGQTPETISEIASRTKTSFRRYDGRWTSDAIRNDLRSQSGEDVPERTKLNTRYFLDEDDLFHHDDQTYVFTNQWGADFQSFVGDLEKSFEFLRITKVDVDGSEAV